VPDHNASKLEADCKPGREITWLAFGVLGIGCWQYQMQAGQTASVTGVTTDISVQKFKKPFQSQIEMAFCI
jgi:hypothetical protein